MPTELDELVEFLHHGNTQIRQIAAENLVGYSTTEPILFKRNQLQPVRDLKLLIKDYAPIAKNALEILVNVAEDGEVLESLIGDDAFLESLLRRVTDPQEPNANLISMLLANMAKSPSITNLLTLARDTPKPLSSSPSAIDQLLDCFVQGASKGRHNDNYDYLCYLFADLAKHPQGREYFLTARKEDNAIVPLAKIIVFTEHGSAIRRRGVANTIKNICFDIDAHARLLSPETLVEGEGIGLLPYLLLPLMGGESYSEEDTEGMLDECQFLPSDKEREAQSDILVTHLESLLLLTTERESRVRLRGVKVYPIVRELHVQVEDPEVREGCDRLVQVLMRDEEGEGEEKDLVGGSEPRIQEVGEENEDEQIVDVL